MREFEQAIDTEPSLPSPTTRSGGPNGAARFPQGDRRLPEMPELYGQAAPRDSPASGHPPAAHRPHRSSSSPRSSGDQPELLRQSRIADAEPHRARAPGRCSGSSRRVTATTTYGRARRSPSSCRCRSAPPTSAAASSPKPSANTRRPSPQPGVGRDPQQPRGPLPDDRTLRRRESEVKAAEKAGFRVNEALKGDIK